MQFLRIADHHFIATEIGSDSCVVDLGVNHGDFLKEIKDNFGSFTVGVEANPNLIDGKRFCDKYFSNAVSWKAGEVSFLMEENDQAGRIVDSSNPTGGTFQKIKCITLEDILQNLPNEKVDLLKIDIEGEEIDLLMKTPDEVLNRCSQVTVEFHDWMNSGQTKQDVHRVIRRMEMLGFWVLSFSIKNTDVLFVKPALMNSSKQRFWYSKYFVKYKLRATRIVRSLFG